MAISTIGANGLNRTEDFVIDGLTVGKGGGAGSFNTALGYQATNSASNSNNGQVAIGYQAMYANTTGYGVGVGYLSLTANTTGINNVAVGHESLKSNTTANSNTAVGYQAGYTNTASENTFLAKGAGYNTTTGSSNLFVGFHAGYYNTTGNYNTYVGHAAGPVTTSGATGSYNTAVGQSSLAASVTSSENTAVGFQAGLNTTVGGNTYLGHNAGRFVTTADSNVCVGNAAGAYASTGTVTTGNGNICIGAYSGVAAGSNNYSIVLGYGITGKGSSTAFVSPQGGAVYNGYNSASWQTTSDRRLKKNIVDNNTGLDIINAIQVRNFEYRLPEEVDEELQPTDAIKRTGVQLGVIAQEIQQVSDEFVTEESTGVLSVNSDNLTWYLVNAVKELKAEIDALKASK